MHNCGVRLQSARYICATPNPDWQPPSITAPGVTEPLLTPLPRFIPRTSARESSTPNLTDNQPTRDQQSVNTDVTDFAQGSPVVTEYPQLDFHIAFANHSEPSDVVTSSELPTTEAPNNSDKHTLSNVASVWGMDLVFTKVGGKIRLPRRPIVFVLECRAGHRISNCQPKLSYLRL